MAETATAARPLTAAERRTMNELLKRDGKAKISEGRSQYQALTALSVPQIDPETGKQTDTNEVVAAGDTVWLTERQAANFMRHGPGTGRMTPAIRPKSEAGQPLPKLSPALLSGPVRQPAPPPRNTDLPRPDPEGSSHLLQMIPEASEPQPGSEEGGFDADAIDIAPSGAAQAAVAGLKQ